MTAHAPTPEIKAAVHRGAIAELIALAIGATATAITGELIWVGVAFFAGSVVMLFLLYRAGAFTRRDGQS
jgi:hypothetical protein